jgi:hypothetical protein
MKFYTIIPAATLATVLAGCATTVAIRPTVAVLPTSQQTKAQFRYADDSCKNFAANDRIGVVTPTNLQKRYNSDYVDCMGALGRGA